MEKTFKFEPMNPLLSEEDPLEWELKAWYSPSEGAFYISYRTVPDRIKDSVIPLYARKSKGMNPSELANAML